MAQAANGGELTFAEIEFAGSKDVDVMISQGGIM